MADECLGVFQIFNSNNPWLQLNLQHLISPASRMVEDTSTTPAPNHQDPIKYNGCGTANLWLYNLIQCSKIEQDLIASISAKSSSSANQNRPSLATDSLALQDAPLVEFSNGVSSSPDESTDDKLTPLEFRHHNFSNSSNEDSAATSIRRRGSLAVVKSPTCSPSTFASSSSSSSLKDVAESAVDSGQILSKRKIGLSSNST